MIQFFENVSEVTAISLKRVRSEGMFSKRVRSEHKLDENVSKVKLSQMFLGMWPNMHFAFAKNIAPADFLWCTNSYAPNCSFNLLSPLQERFAGRRRREVPPFISNSS